MPYFSSLMFSTFFFVLGQLSGGVGNVAAEQATIRQG